MFLMIMAFQITNYNALPYSSYTALRPTIRTFLVSLIYLLCQVSGFSETEQVIYRPI